MCSETPEIITRLDCGQPFQAIVGCDLTPKQARTMIEAGTARPAPTPELPTVLLLHSDFLAQTGVTHPRRSTLTIGEEVTRTEAHALLRARCAAPATHPAEPAFGTLSERSIERRGRRSRASRA